MELTHLVPFHLSFEVTLFCEDDSTECTIGLRGWTKEYIIWTNKHQQHIILYYPI